jgi:hypothetical protein
MLGHISETRQVHNLYSEGTIVYCSSAPGVSRHLHPVKIPKAFKIS